MNAFDSFPQTAAEDGQSNVSMSMMDCIAAFGFEQVAAALKSTASNLEIIAWNTSSVDTTDMTNQITDLLADLEAMKARFEESL